jgi:hypothetical protein
MAREDGPKEPTRPTVKRLFALSGNRCAFPECTTPLIDPKSGSVVGEICHIKGDKPGAPRFDCTQSNEERQSFKNLLLLCNVHHKIVDDDEELYTVDKLCEMKLSNESRSSCFADVDETATERFVSVAMNNSNVQGSIITSCNQIGGQVAHIIHNHYGSALPDEPIQLEAKVDMANDLQILSALGCAGVRLTVICRGVRQAKIQSAHLLIDNVDVISAFEQGFGASFGYTPLEGSTQTMDVTLLALSRPNSQEGYILNRDDVVRFFYPLPLPSTTLALQAKPVDLSMTVKFFDDSEQSILAGQPIQDLLADLFRVYQHKPGEFNGTISIGIRVKSTAPPGPEWAELIGKVNPNAMPMAKADVDIPSRHHTGDGE